MTRPKAEDFSVTRRWVQRSGHEFLAALTGRSEMATRWISKRVEQLKELNWSVKGIHSMLRDEIDRATWEQPEGEGT